MFLIADLLEILQVSTRYPNNMSLSDAAFPSFQGRKLRSKISGLYPNSHFELIAERDAAWVTQFVFLKALNCSQENSKRESDRKDDWGDGHLSYNQSAIWEQSKLTAQAGRGVNAPEGIDGVVDILKKESPGIAGQFKKDDIRETLGV